MRGHRYATRRRRLRPQRNPRTRKAAQMAPLPHIEPLMKYVSVIQEERGSAYCIPTFSNALIVQTHHTSPQSFNTLPERKEEARDAFLHVAQIVKQL